MSFQMLENKEHVKKLCSEIEEKSKKNKRKTRLSDLKIPREGGGEVNRLPQGKKQSVQVGD